MFLTNRWYEKQNAREGIKTYQYSALILSSKSMKNKMPARALRLFGFGIDELPRIAYEKQNAREGIKTKSCAYRVWYQTEF